MTRFIVNFILEHFLQQGVDVHGPFLQMEPDGRVAGVVGVVPYYLLELGGHKLKVVVVSVHHVQLVVVQDGLFTATVLRFGFLQNWPTPVRETHLIDLCLQSSLQFALGVGIFQ